MLPVLPPAVGVSAGRLGPSTRAIDWRGPLTGCEVEHMATSETVFLVHRAGAPGRAGYPAIARIRRGFSTVIWWISASPTPAARSRGRNASWRYV